METLLRVVAGLDAGRHADRGEAAGHRHRGHDQDAELDLDAVEAVEADWQIRGRVHWRLFEIAMRIDQSRIDMQTSVQQCRMQPGILLGQMRREINMG